VSSDTPRAGQGPPRVLLLAGSPGDLDTVLKAEETLNDLGIASELRVVSAHRTPDAATSAARTAEAEGFSVIIAFAGLAAHLAGVTAAHSMLPVIGVPLSGGPLKGIDAALATLQMPPGTPVGTVAIDGAKNAALLAARILALNDAAVRKSLDQILDRDRERYRPERIEAVLKQGRQKRGGR
jgi:5-(carboxyamino)imidazole ribonucleotide mutase